MNPPPVIVKVTGHVSAMARSGELRYLDENISRGQRVDIEAIIKFLSRKRRRRFRSKWER